MEIDPDRREEFLDPDDDDDEFLNDEELLDELKDKVELEKEKIFLKKLYVLDLEQLLKESSYKRFAAWLADLSLSDFVGAYHIATAIEDDEEVNIEEDLGVLWFKYAYGFHPDSSYSQQPHYEMIECRIPESDTDISIPADYDEYPIFHFEWEDFRDEI